MKLIRLILLCMIVFISAMFVVLHTDGKEIIKEERTGYIYLGDSRFVGMNKYCHMDKKKDTWCVAKVGQGLSWMKKTAIVEVEDIVAENKDIENWVLIIGLGVNDLNNIDNYIEEYDSLEGFEIILVSVNPMEKDKADKYGYDYDGLSPKIVKFNNKLKETSYQYIDTYSAMINNGYSTVDGLHYTKKTYTYIYNVIKSYMKGDEVSHEMSIM